MKLCDKIDGDAGNAAMAAVYFPLAPLKRWPGAGEVALSRPWLCRCRSNPPLRVSAGYIPYIVSTHPE